MSFKRIITGIVSAVSILALWVAPVYAKTYKTEVTNNVSIGDINIQLLEYTLDDKGKEIDMPYSTVVLPGQDLPQIVRIMNIANDAWIRVKLQFQSDSELKGLDESLVTFFAPDEWKKVGDYYYALKPLKHGTGTDFMKSIHIPEYWTEAYSNKTFRIVVTADAVQYKNFKPDFNSDDPWFGTAIEQCVHDRYETPAKVTDTAFSVEFRGGAEGFLRTGDDFFSNWGELMPGDTVEGTVKLRNRYSSGIKLYFKTETIDDDALLETLDLTIRATDGSIIYQGKMDKELSKKVLLGEFPSGSDGRLTYTVHVPEELTNKYALSKTKTKWIFETELDKSKAKKEKDTDGKDGKGSSSDKTGRMGPVQTGDEMKFGIYVILIAAAMMVVVMVDRKGGERCGKENK